MENTKLSHILLALLVVIFWGFNFMFIKIALTQIEPFTMLTLRFFFSACILIPFYPKPPIKLSRILPISFIFSVLHLVCMFWGLYLGIDSGLGNVVQQLGIPFALILAMIFFKERVGGRTICGITLAFIGTLFLMNAPNSLDNLPAFFLIVASAFFWALYSNELKRLKSPSALALVAWISLLSCIIMFPISLIFEDNQLQMIKTMDFKVLVSVFYAVICASIGAHGLWGYLLKHNPIYKIIPMVLLVPIFAIFAGVVFLGEELTTPMMIGAILMIMGVGITFIRKPIKVEVRVTDIRVTDLSITNIKKN